MAPILCALPLFAWLSTASSAEDAAAKPDIGNRMTMSVSIPLSLPEQASPEPAPKVLSAREQEIEDLNVQIAQMQSMIKSLQSSLPSSAPTAPASSVPQAPAKALPVKPAPPAAHSASFPLSPVNMTWLLAAAAFTFWLFRKWTTRNTMKQAETQPDIATSSIKTPAHTESVSGNSQNTALHEHVIEAGEVDSMIEEAELYAIHGHLKNAIEILNNIIFQHPERIEVWLLLLSIFRENAHQFEVIAEKFLKTVGRNDAWREIQQVGCCIDPENPLYFDPDMQTPQVKPEKLRALGSIMVDIQALSKEDLKKDLSQFDHLRDGKLGSLLLEKAFIGQRKLDEALKLQNKESKKCQPAKLLESMVRPRSISDVLIRMGAVTEPELEHVLADFDPKRDGHCGNYLVSSGLITQNQLYAALLQQLSGMMEDGA